MLNERETVHLHEYSRIYAVPGLYEYVVQDRLRCRSPQIATEGFLRAAAELGLAPHSVTVLDFGAVTRLVGELLRDAGISQVVGLDALPAARTACLRDRPGTYADYIVGDVSDSALRSYSFDGFISAGALGGTHAPPDALVKALGLVPAGAPVSITIDERWLDDSDPDGFRAAFTRLAADRGLVVIERSRFQHRVTTTGEPIFYSSSWPGPADVARPRRQCRSFRKKQRMSSTNKSGTSNAGK